MVAKEDIKLNHSANNNLTNFGKAVLTDRYLLAGEDFQQLFARVASYYSDSKEHAQRLYTYMSDLWFMPATPILSNGGTNRGLPISCFLNEISDSFEGIVDKWNENIWLAARGGGIGTYWGNVRSIGEQVKGNGKTSGIIPFIRVQDSLTLAISQGSLRRGNAAMYLPVYHPEIEEFIDMRKPTGGDPNRKALNIHHGIIITDKFMHAVREDKPWDLISPKDGSIISTIKATELWIKILTTRLETGEPYLLFIDTVNRAIPAHQQQLGLNVKMSNLCSEITLPTGRDHLGHERTAVCCLSSLNLEHYEQWSQDPLFINDIMLFLDNVLQDFINKADPAMKNAVYSAMRERSVGLGVMGWHSFLQSKMVAIESTAAKDWNKQIFSYIHKQATAASQQIALERGPCLDAKEAGVMERFSNKTAIAPTAAISTIAGNASPGIEPYAANSFTQKTHAGSFNVRNKHLAALLAAKGQNNEKIWSSITTREGSVQHLDFLSVAEKAVFKTAMEIDQRCLIELAAERTQYISQAQSLNVFLPSNISKKELHLIHFNAWQLGVKSMYYCRSASLQRADKVSHKVEAVNYDFAKKPELAACNINAAAEECLACQ